MAGIASSALFIVIYENKVEPIEKIIQKHSQITNSNPKLAYLQDYASNETDFEGSGDFEQSSNNNKTRSKREFASFEKFNFVIIIADDLGWADVSWNNEFVKTPNLERIRKQGRTFTNLYSHSTCSPSRAALLTGIYAWRLGLDGAPFNPTKVNGIPLGVELIPAKFKKLNYENHFIGKWHGGFCHQNLTPTERGFDSFYGFYSGAVNYLTHESKYDAKGAALDYREVKDGKEKILKEKNDHNIGRIYDKIRDQNGVWERTVFLFVSDNGATAPGGSNYPLRGVKGDYFEGGNKVPGFIISPVFKEQKLKRSSYDGIVHFADLMVSLLGLADPTERLITDQLDGMNLWNSLIEKDATVVRRETIHHIDQSPKPAREVESNVFLQHAQWRLNQSSDASFVYSASIRVEEYKYIKAVRNVRKNMFPFAAINEDWTWDSPSEISPPVSIANRF
ncbi:unnamed protein product, partial [Oikopleura dioica]